MRELRLMAGMRFSAAGAYTCVSLATLCRLQTGRMPTQCEELVGETSELGRGSRAVS